MESIRIVVADDHPVVREGIRNRLEKEPDFLVVGEAGDGEEALSLAGELQPDVLLLDMELPDLTGVEVARRVKSPVRILVVSAYDDEHYIRRMLASGASGYLTKEEAPESLIEAVRRVAWSEGKITQPTGDGATSGLGGGEG